MQGLTKNIDALYLQRLHKHIRDRLGARVESISTEDMPLLFSLFAKAQNDTLSLDSRWVRGWGVGGGGDGKLKAAYCCVAWSNAGCGCQTGFAEGKWHARRGALATLSLQVTQLYTMV